MEEYSVQAVNGSLNVARDTQRMKDRKDKKKKRSQDDNGKESKNGEEVEFIQE